MKVFACVLLAVAAQAAPEADPAILYGDYAGLPYAGVYGYAYAAAVVPSASLVTGNSVPVAVGGYKAVAGSNGDLVGPIHEVPGLVPALAVNKQESSGDVSLSTGTGALVASPLVYHYGKREAEANPALLYGGYPGLPYAGVYGAGVYGAGVYGAGVYGAGVYGYPNAASVAPALTYAIKPLELKTEVTATNLPVPVAIGGYKAEAGNNGDLVGAVHEVPGLLPAPALLKQVNSNGGALTVGTSAVVSHSFVKREAEAEADPALLYGAYGYAGLGYAGYGYSGHGYAGYGYSGHGYAGYAGHGYSGLGYAGYPHTYGAYAGYPYYG